MTTLQQRQEKLASKRKENSQIHSTLYYIDALKITIIVNFFFLQN